MNHREDLCCNHRGGGGGFGFCFGSVDDEEGPISGRIIDSPMDVSVIRDLERDAWMRKGRRDISEFMGVG